MTRRARAVLAVACGAHFIHDGFSDILYVLLPVWATEFGLTFAQVGLLKTLYTGGMATFQLPASLLAERRGEAWLLAAGTAVTALGFLLAGLTGGFVALLACLLLGGLGSGCQHPLSSALVARAYETGPRRTALGTYNFSGDLGKVAVPALIALTLPWLGWRRAVEGYAVVGLLAAGAILLLLGRLDAGHRPAVSRADGALERAGSGIRDVRAFTAISAIHVIDNSTRTGFLTFLPFLLIAKGATVQSVGLALMLVFIGGAVGKFACGALADRVGVIRTVLVTEIVTGGGILLLLALPLGVCLVTLPVLGVALNGTSSVLYGSVADLVSSGRRARSYAIFYTLGIGASALAPFAYGLLSDWGGVRLTLTVVGIVVLLTLPLTLPLRQPAAPPHRGQVLHSDNVGM
jgi:MFS family permease